MVKRLSGIVAFCTLAACLGDAPPVANLNPGDGGAGMLNPTCSDGIQNGLETGVDCGGDCLQCAGTAGSCTDKVKNGTESDIDCGGSCAGCSTGTACTTGTDCLTGNCGADKTCADWNVTFVPTSTGAAYGPRIDGIARDASGAAASLVQFVVPNGGGALQFASEKLATGAGTNGQYYALVKTDPSGAVTWSALLGDGNSLFVPAVDFDPTGNLFVAGRVSINTHLGVRSPSSLSMGNDGELAKYDATGNETKAIRIGANMGGSSELAAVKALPNGDTLIAGGCAPAWQIETNLGATIPAGNGEDFCIARLDSNLLPTWTKAFGGTSDDVISSLAVDSKGDIIAAGYWNSDTISVPLTGGAKKVLTRVGAASTYNRDVIVLKLSGSNGDIQWATSAGTTQYDSPLGLDVGPNDDVILAGQSSSDPDTTIGQTFAFGTGGPQTCQAVDCGWAARLNGMDGTQFWLKMFSGTAPVMGACADKDGNLSITAPVESAPGLLFGFGARQISPPAGFEVLTGTLAFADGDTLAIHDYGEAMGQYAGPIACSKTSTAVTIAGVSTGIATWPGGSSPAGLSATLFTVDKIPLDPAAP